jgi:hypothetical protein
MSLQFKQSVRKHVITLNYSSLQNGKMLTGRSSTAIAGRFRAPRFAPVNVFWYMKEKRCNPHNTDPHNPAKKELNKNI